MMIATMMAIGISVGEGAAVAGVCLTTGCAVVAVAIMHGRAVARLDGHDRDMRRLHKSVNCLNTKMSKQAVVMARIATRMRIDARELNGADDEDEDDE